MQDSSLLMCKGEVTKTTANNGLLPLLGTGNACVVSWFLTGSVGDSILKCVHVVAGDYFLCWHSIYFTAFSLKTGLVLLSDWTWVGVEWVRAELTTDYLLICFCNNCRSIFSSAFFLWCMKNLSTLGFVPFIHARVKMSFHDPTLGPASGSLFCLYKAVVRFVWHTWHLRVTIMCST